MAFWLESTTPLPGGIRMQASYGIDSLADIASLPPLSDSCAEGSDAFSVSEQELVFLCSDGVWR